MKKKGLIAGLLGVLFAATLVIGGSIIVFTEKPQPEIVKVENTFLG
ncbi:hypothetical protein [Clostridium polynesiense]|nr:hypothetical protein [Clostridium polynesiense]